MFIYGEPRSKGISTKHIGSHRWTPKHVKKDEEKEDSDKKKDNRK